MLTLLFDMLSELILLVDDSNSEVDDDEENVSNHFYLTQKDLDHDNFPFSPIKLIK